MATTMDGTPRTDETPRDGTAEPSEGAEEHGRIGYGRYGRYTPLVLAAVLLVGVVAIGLYQDRDNADGPTVGVGHLIGRPAPDVSLTRLDGATLRLADLRGSVVLVNFWASWCAPCKEEMPVFQTVHDAAAANGERVAVVGVGIRTDHDADARAFVRTYGLTYPIGRDTETDAPGVGPIERAFGIPSSYPTTVVLRPDGVIDAVHVGPMDDDQMRAAIDGARASAGEGRRG